MRTKKPRLTSIVAQSLSPRSGGGFGPRPASRSPLEVALRAFRTDCDDAIQDLRRALLSLARESDSDPLKPQEVSRRFALNKNLTWKFARVLLAPDSFAAIPMLPALKAWRSTFVHSKALASISSTLIPCARRFASSTPLSRTTSAIARNSKSCSTDSAPTETSRLRDAWLSKAWLACLACGRDHASPPRFSRPTATTRTTPM